MLNGKQTLKLLMKLNELADAHNSVARGVADLHKRIEDLEKRLDKLKWIEDGLK